VLLVLLAMGVAGTAGYVVLSPRDDAQTSAPPADASAGGSDRTQFPTRATPVTSGQRSPTILLARRDPLRMPFRDPPRGGLLFDLDTGHVLWRHDPVRRLPIASLTKIMTAVLVVEQTRPSERVRVPRAAIHHPGSGIGVLKRRRLVPVEGLLYGMMVASGNDAAASLAYHVGGSERRFARLMNQRARRQGLSCTRFVDSHGLSNRNLSCAADLAALARLAMWQPRIARAVSEPHPHVRFPIKGGRLFLSTHNPLLLSGYRGTIGLKTGYTSRAGRCLVAVVRRGQRTFGVVLLHSPDPGGQARRLLDAAFRRT
jgi:D-alanyl-D-alanine carboxypeptidase (penicillin-binding protein 5/6)